MKQAFRFWSTLLSLFGASVLFCNAQDNLNYLIISQDELVQYKTNTPFPSSRLIRKYYKHLGLLVSDTINCAYDFQYDYTVNPLAPVHFRGYYFSPTVVYSPSLSLEDNYILSHLLRNILVSPVFLSYYTYRDFPDSIYLGNYNQPFDSTLIPNDLLILSDSLFSFLNRCRIDDQLRSETIDCAYKFMRFNSLYTSRLPRTREYYLYIGIFSSLALKLRDGLRVIRNWGNG